MAGLVKEAIEGKKTNNSAQSNLKDETLRQIDTQMQSRVPAEAKEMYDAITTAGMKLAFDPKMQDKLMQGLQSSPDMVKNIALVVTGIIGMVYTESKQNINNFAPAMIPAAVSLMCDIMQFASDAGMIEITPEVVGQCSSQMTKAVLKKFGIGDEQVKQVITAGKQAQTVGMGA